MWNALLTFIVKVFIGLVTATLIEYNMKQKKQKNKINKMSNDRIFDTFTADVKEDILETAIAYAKADIAEFNLPDELIPYAVGFGEMFLLEESDFILIETLPIIAWAGGRPPHRPKLW